MPSTSGQHGFIKIKSGLTSFNFIFTTLGNLHWQIEGMLKTVQIDFRKVYDKASVLPTSCKVIVKINSEKVVYVEMP